MAFVIRDRVKVTTTTTGTGTYTLGSAVSGYQDFAAIGDGNTTYYTVTDNVDWEVGIGTFTSSGTTLSRDTIISSSNGGSAVNWGAGTKEVFVPYIGDRSVYEDGASIVASNNATFSSSAGGTGAATLTSNNVLLGNGTSAVQFVAPGSSGNELTSNGSTWTSAPGPADVDAGTRMLFVSTTAPTGWTKDTSNYNNHALRATTSSASTGGSVDFTSAFASQTPTGSASVSSQSLSNHTLSLAQTPNNTGQIQIHNAPESNWKHNPSAGGSMYINVGGSGNHRPGGAIAGGANSVFNWAIRLQGTSTAHGHSLSGLSASYSANAINLAVKYVDVITATKD